MLRSGRLGAEVIGRIHGDHFAFLVKRENFDEGAVRECFHQLSRKIEDSEYVLQYCVGVYEVRDPAEDVFVMCDHANIAISSIRQESDIIVAYYNDNMMKHILRENEVIAEFDPALKAGQFRIFLQPIVKADGELTGAEALVRWFRENGEMVPPGDFIGILEESGLIYKLDLFVWEEAAKTLNNWKGTPLEKLSVSVNISPRDIIYVDIEKEFEKLVRRYDIPRSKLNLEFTETTLMSDVERYIDLVASLREKGFHVEVDDFGSGYSSLNMLKDIRADVLKIDMGFLQETENREQSRIILASIVEMAGKLRMTVITEGVEKDSQVRLLAEMGCDLFQGYFFSRPVSVEEFEGKYLKR